MEILSMEKRTEFAEDIPALVLRAIVDLLQKSVGSISEVSFKGWKDDLLMM
jgi:hypothetical protein